MSENSPFVYSKTMGFNQLDRPVFKKYKLVEETNRATESDLTKEPITLSSDKEKAEIKAIWSEIDHIKRDIKNMSHRRERKEVKSNE